MCTFQRVTSGCLHNTTVPPEWAKYGPSCCTAAGVKPMSPLRSKADLGFFENWVKLLHCKGLKHTNSGLRACLGEPPLTRPTPDEMFRRSECLFPDSSGSPKRRTRTAIRLASSNYRTRLKVDNDWTLLLRRHRRQPLSEGGRHPDDVETCSQIALARLASRLSLRTRNR